MQAVILAAGKGKRMLPLSESKPKPLLEVGGKSVLEHKLDILPSEITEIILVVGYRGAQLRERLGNSYNGIPIKYVDQEQNTGTGGALWLTQDLLAERFLVMMGDDLYSKRDILECLKHKWAICVQKKKYDKSHTFIGGNVIVDDENRLKDIEEGEHNGKICRINTALYVLGKEIFKYPLVPKSPGSEEFGLPQTLITALPKITVDIVECTNWLPVTSPSDLEKAEDWLKENY